MYCGDETGSFIGDVGSHVSRFGYGGEDSPKHVVPSYCYEHADDEGDSRQGRLRVASSCYNPKGSAYRTPLRTVEAPRDDNGEQPIVDPAKFLQQGDSVQDWDAYETLWQSAFDALHVTDRYKHTKGRGIYKADAQPGSESTVATSGVKSTSVSSASANDAQSPSEGKCVHPLLVVSPGCTHRIGTKDGPASHRKELVQLTELMMEKMDCQSLFVAPAPMLAAFSHGRQTALVVDVGASGCRVTPVVDGLVMKQAQRRNGRGGDWLGNVQWKALMEEKTVVRPRYQVSKLSSTGTSSAPSVSSGRGIFHRWAMQDLMYEFRTSGYVQLAHWWYDPTVPFLYNDSDDENSADKMDMDSGTNTYELPDGTLVDLTNRIGKDLCRIPELFFSQDLPFLPDDYANQTDATWNAHASLSNAPLPKLVHNSLSAVGDVDTRKELVSSILLTGGSSLFGNLEKRLSLEMTRITSSAYKCKVTASRHSIERSCASWIGGSILSSLGSFQQLWLSRTEYEEYGATLAVQRFP